MESKFLTRVADPHHLNVDPDPAAPYQDDVSLGPLAYRPSRAPRLHLKRPGPLWLHFKPLKLLNFVSNADPDPSIHFHADPDPSFHFNADPGPAPKTVRIRIRNPAYGPLD
jgi:hypothetical protein